MWEQSTMASGTIWSSRWKSAARGRWLVGNDSAACSGTSTGGQLDAASVLAHYGLEGLPVPFGAPNGSPHVKRFMRTLRKEALDHFVFLNFDHNRRVVSEYVRLSVTPDYRNLPRISPSRSISSP